MNVRFGLKGSERERRGGSCRNVCSACFEEFQPVAATTDAIASWYGIKGFLPPSKNSWKLSRLRMVENFNFKQTFELHFW